MTDSSEEDAPMSNSQAASTTSVAENATAGKAEAGKVSEVAPGLVEKQRSDTAAPVVATMQQPPQATQGKPFRGGGKGSQSARGSGADRGGRGSYRDEGSRGGRDGGRGGRGSTGRSSGRSGGDSNRAVPPLPPATTTISGGTADAAPASSSIASVEKSEGTKATQEPSTVGAPVKAGNAEYAAKALKKMIDPQGKFPKKVSDEVQCMLYLF